MRPNDLLLRCYALKEDETWVASCIDLCLAAQGESFEEAKTKLEEMISDYIYEATVGPDRAFAGQLLRRKAPWPEFVRYYAIKGLRWTRLMRTGLRRIFDETLPLAPCAPRQA